ncbi:hypothetical protein FHW84_001769 [Dyella sp. SG562]|uniref:hypothetical protein n=1 Tax=Dyella sp. SG562 TaxID=2587017 RepID=UPI00141F4421|nr:hypothetical protein [Dyella sp. SG562]NII73200.1 hypothetical protein [Dyella sp. SG562]
MEGHRPRHKAISRNFDGPISGTSSKTRKALETKLSRAFFVLFGQAPPSLAMPAPLP